MRLPIWRERSPEEANHFNPAYCGALIYEFVHSYTRAKSGPPSFCLPFCAMPVALHPDTRDRLPRSIITSLYPWLERNPDVLVGYDTRAQNLGPVDEVDSQGGRSVIQDWLLGGGLGSRVDDGRGVGVFPAL
ncbi:three component ABC system middle component, partial [Rhodothalassium salexigens]